MVDYRTAFPEAITESGMLNDIAMQMAMAGKAFLISAGLFTAPMNDAIGAEVDTAEDYNLIAQTIRENREAVQQHAATTLNAGGGAEEIFMLQATFGIMDPEGFGSHATNYIGDSGFGQVNDEILAEVTSLLSDYINVNVNHDIGANAEPDARVDTAVDAAVAATPTAHAYPPVLGQQEYTDYFISNVLLHDYSPHTRSVWELSRTPDMTMQSAINTYLNSYILEAHAEYEKEYGRPMSGHAAAEFRNYTLGEFRNQLTQQINEITQNETALRNMPGMVVSPTDIAQSYVRNAVLQPAAATIYERMITDGVDFEKAYNDIFQHVGRTITLNSADSLDNMKSQLRENIENAQQLEQLVETYESIVITPDDAMRYMGAAWERNDSLPNTPEHYLHYMQDRISHYMSDEGGRLDAQTASVRAAIEARDQVDLDKGVRPSAITPPGSLPYQMDLFEDSIRREIMVNNGYGLTDEQKDHYRSTQRHHANVDSMSQLDYLSMTAGAFYASHRDDALKSATDTAYERAYEQMDNPSPAAQSPAQDAASSQTENDVDATNTDTDFSTLQAKLMDSYHDFLSDMPENPSPEQIEVINNAETLQNEFLDAYNEENFESFLRNGDALARLLSENAIDEDAAQTLGEYTDTISAAAQENGIALTDPTPSEFALEESSRPLPNPHRDIMTAPSAMGN